jgi:DNA-binding transcriptional LysR family regulator
MTYDLNDLYFFAKVIEHGGFSPASRALGMVPSQLSRRIARLEQQLGVHLLHRTTRSISLSAAGETFYRHCVAMLAEVEAARAAMERTRAAPYGVVRMSCPVGLLLSEVSPILARYLSDNPGVRVNLEATNRRVDVVEEGFDLALRVRFPPLEDSDLAVRPLAQSNGALVCSPWFISRYGEPGDVQDLARLPTLSMVRPGDRYAWSLTRGDGTAAEVRLNPRLVTDDLTTLREAALQGVGIAMLPFSLIRKDLSEGALVQVLPQVQLPSGLVHAVFPSRRGLVPAVRALIDALAEGFAEATDRP